MLRSVKRPICRIVVFLLLIMVIPMMSVRAAEEDDLLDSVIADIVASIPDSVTTDFQKALYLHDYIVNHVVYKTTPNDQTAYGALIEGEAVCAGYSDAYQRLLNAVGIPAETVTGRAWLDGGWENHAWNMVWLDGKCYFTDVTWDDPFVDGVQQLSYTYFNLSLEQMSADHELDSRWDSTVPDSCHHTDMNYYSICAGAGTGVGVFDDSTTAAQAAACFVLSANDGTYREYYCDFRFDGDNLNAWIVDNWVAIAEALNLSGSLNCNYIESNHTCQITLSGSDNIPDVHQHVDPLRFVSEKAADCTQSGTAAHYICDSCGTLFTDPNAANETTLKDLVLTAVGHTDDDDDGTCDACGENLRTDTPEPPPTAPQTQPTAPATSPAGTSAETTAPTSALIPSLDASSAPESEKASESGNSSSDTVAAGTSTEDTQSTGVRIYIISAAVIVAVAAIRIPRMLKRRRRRRHRR